MPRSPRLPGLGACLAACVLLTPVLADAQVYADWSRSIPMPTSVVDVRGGVCRLDGHTAYVAGDELVIVDVSAGDAPVVLGRATLPAGGVDLALRWPFAYAACGTAGLVEVDVTDPVAIRVVRSYRTGAPITQVTFAGALIVAVDADSRLHLLATDSTGQLAAVAVHDGPGTIRRCTGVNGYLALATDSELVIIDVRAPGVLARTDSYWLYNTGASPDRFMDADGSRLVLVRPVEEYVDYNYAYYSMLAAFTVDDSGRLGAIRGRPDRRAKAVAIAGGMIAFTRDDGLTRFLDAAELQPAASIRLAAESVAMDDGRLIASSAGSVSVLDLGPGGNIRPVRVVYGGLSEEPYNSVDYTLHAVDWAPPFALRYLYRYYNSGYHSGYESVSIDYGVCDAADPLSLRIIASGTAGGIRYPDDMACFGFGSAGLPDNVGTSVIVSSTSGCVRTLRVIARSDGREICRFTSRVNPYEGRSDKVIFAGSGSVWVWTRADRTLARHSLHAPDPSTPSGEFPMESIGTLFAPDARLIINAFADHVDVYDASDMSALVLMASDDTVRGANSHVYAWLGRTLVYAPAFAPEALHAVDFTDPTHPVQRVVTPLPARPNRIVADGRRFALVYGTGGFQTGEIDAAGAVALRSPLVHTGVGTSGLLRFLMAGNVAYGDDGACILAFDIRDLARPRFIGRAFRGAGNLALVGDYLASGNLLLPRDIRDAAVPRRITIDIRPALRVRLPDDNMRRGIVPVAVLGDETFAAIDLDPATVRFGPAGAAPTSRTPGAAVRRKADIDGDGDLDVLFHFRLDETGLEPSATEATLTGLTYAGEAVAGTGRLRDGPPVELPPGTRLALSPNPFNPQTTVAYTLAAAGEARVAVYDVRGRRVALLADGRHEAGAHAAVWRGLDDRGRAVPSGTYFVRVEADGQVLTRKALLVK